MRPRMLLFVVLALALSWAMPLMAADAPAQPVQKSYDGFYWDTKHQMGYVLGTVVDHGWIPIGVGTWLGGFHNDRFLLGGTSLDLIITSGERDPYASLGFTIAPIGICFQGCYRGGIRSPGEVGAYLKPAYTRLVGLNGRVANPNAFSLQVSFAWKKK